MNNVSMSGNGTASIFKADSTANCEPTDIGSKLLNDFHEAKKAEDAAKARRLEAETALVAHIGKKDEGGTVKKAIGDTEVKTSVTISRKITAADANALKGKVPGPLFDRLVKYEPKVVAREFNYIAENEPDVLAVIAEHITSKPGKPSVSVKEA